MTAPPPTILIVDDEEALLRISARLLERSGFSVLVAANGVEGLELWHKRQGEIGLIITDVAMPRMGGHDLLEQVRVEAPDLPVIMMSGDPDGESEYLARFRRVRLVVKPWLPEELVALVREMTGG
jgi:two-component system cell cycle sensor histidine kinase/response regulator CckA